MSDAIPGSDAAGVTGVGVGLSRELADAWRLVRRARPLRLLGAISAAQAAVYSAVVLLMVLPSLALPQLVVPLQEASTAVGTDAPQLNSLSRTMLASSQWVVSHLGGVVAGIVVLFAVWIASGVFDVAAQAGSITQVARELEEGAPSSVRAGMRDGFGVWWQTIGLLAVAALPALALVLGLGVSTLFTYSFPLMRGALPNPATAASAQLLLTPLQGIVSVVSIVLGVVVQLSLRFVALERMSWRRALGRGWGMVRAHVADVTLLYVFATAIGAAVVFGASIVTGALALVVGGLVGGAAMLLGMPSLVAAIWAAVGVAVIAALVGVAVQAVFLAWYSAVWTLFWRRLRGVGARVHGVAPEAGGGTLSDMRSAASGQL